MSNDPSIFRFKATDTVDDLLARNKAWAQRTSALNPSLFPALAEGQAPQILWIGCSDSRVPETTLLDLLPGEVFVHRNIANVLPHGDISSLGVIQFAVEILKVRMVIVCGHTSCGGVKAALGNDRLGPIDNWLKHIRDVRAHNRKELEAIKDIAERCDRLVELNVIAQVHNLMRLANIRDAIASAGLQVYGMVHDVGTGEARRLDIPEDPHPDMYGLIKA